MYATLIYPKVGETMIALKPIPGTKKINQEVEVSSINYQTGVVNVVFRKGKEDQVAFGVHPKDLMPPGSEPTEEDFNPEVVSEEEEEK